MFLKTILSETVRVFDDLPFKECSLNGNVEIGYSETQVFEHTLKNLSLNENATLTMAEFWYLALLLNKLSVNEVVDMKYGRL